uniref:Uncharacterized protein n=1 Tax=viral metagenome TaxID=1070528 RepID=A0A6C0KWR3_9ZZZZ
MPSTKKGAAKPKPRAKKGGAAGDAWPGPAIAGPVTPMAGSTPFNSDVGLSTNMQYPATAAQLSAVNMYQGAGGKKKQTRRGGEEPGDAEKAARAAVRQWHENYSQMAIQFINAQMAHENHAPSVHNSTRPQGGKPKSKSKSNKTKK